MHGKNVMKKTKIKICGITSTEELKWLMEEKVEYAGVVLFYKGSKRYCASEQAECIVKMAKEQGEIIMVAVCVSPTLEEMKLVCDMGFDMIQIHGEISAQTISRCKIPVIRAFSHEHIPEETYAKEPNLSAILLDSVRPGSGEAYGWDQMEQNDIQKIRSTGRKVFLAGGLRYENVSLAIQIVSPDVVDCSSGVERDGLKGKDREKIRNFVREVRRYE